MIEAVLGTGGFGTVYRARERELDRDVALKLLHASVLADDEQVARFVNEARIAATLVHPGIVRLLDAGIDGQTPWIAYELIEGPSLERRLRAGPLGPAEAVSLGIQIGQALAFSHRHGVFHRDVKSENVFVPEEGRYQLGDFGIAKCLDSQAFRTGTGLVLGTPGSMAPEVVTGAPATGLSDLYSLGVLLFVALTGEPPFKGRSPVEIIDAQLASPPPRADRVRPAVSPALGCLVARAMATRPEDRPPGIDELVAGLEALGRDFPEPVREVPTEHVPKETVPQPTTRVARSRPPLTSAARPQASTRAPRTASVVADGRQAPRGSRIPLLALALGFAIAAGSTVARRDRGPTPSVTPTASPGRDNRLATGEAIPDAASLERTIRSYYDRERAFDDRFRTRFYDSQIDLRRTLGMLEAELKPYLTQVVRDLARLIQSADEAAAPCLVWLGIEALLEGLTGWFRRCHEYGEVESVRRHVRFLEQRLDPDGTGRTRGPPCRRALVHFHWGAIHPFVRLGPAMESPAERAKLARELLCAVEILRQLPRDDAAWWNGVQAQHRMLCEALDDLGEIPIRVRSTRGGQSPELVLQARSALLDVGEWYLETAKRLKADLTTSTETSAHLVNAWQLHQSAAGNATLQARSQSLARRMWPVVSPKVVPSEYRDDAGQALAWLARVSPEQGKAPGFQELVRALPR